MDPVGKRGYIVSKIENLNLSNQLLAEAQQVYEKPDTTIDDLDILQEAYEKAQKGYNILKNNNPDAAASITLPSDIQKKILKLQKTPEPSEEEFTPKEKEVMQKSMEDAKEGRIKPLEIKKAKPKKKTPRRRKYA